MLLALQRRMMFFPEALARDAPLAFSLPHEERWFTSPTGHELHAVVVRSSSSSLSSSPAAGKRGTILYFHGNAGSVRSWGEVGCELAPLGYDVVVVDYAGFGKSRGAIDEASLHADAAAVYDAVVRGVRHDDARHAGAFDGVDERDIVVFGRSIGTGIAVKLASVRRPRLLVLETPYASIADLAQRMFPALAAFSTSLPITLRSDLWMPSVRCPVHVLHGSADEVIPLASADKLRPLLPAGSSFTVVDGGHHNDLAMFPPYREALAAILG